MRITLVIAGLQGGGAERVCINLANAWSERGNQVSLLTIYQHGAPPAYTLDPGVQRRDLGWPRLANSVELNHTSIAPLLRFLDHTRCSELIGEIPLLATLRHAILATQPSVVVPQIDMTNIRVLAALPETGIPVIACEQTDTSQFSLGKWQRVRGALYRRAAAVVAPHQRIADWLAGDGARAFTIPNPLVAPLVAPRFSPTPGNFTATGNRRRIVALTRLSPEKRPALLVRAFATILHAFPDWDCDVYGEGPLRPALADLIDELTPGRIQLHRFTNRPYEVLKQADLFVSTSWLEGFGNSIWEALACGVPVVAMEAGASVRSLVRDGIDGLIVSQNNVADLASALASLMGDDEKRQVFAMRAPEVVKRFSMETSLEAWDHLLDDVTL
jgi:glycosyltransferase involved in cell wall biosynthesis